MLVTIPAGVVPGMQLQVQAPSGQTMLVTVPQGSFLMPEENTAVFVFTDLTSS